MITVEQVLKPEGIEFEELPGGGFKVVVPEVILSKHERAADNSTSASAIAPRGSASRKGGISNASAFRWEMKRKRNRTRNRRVFVELRGGATDPPAPAFAAIRSTRNST
jgi:hypothetical protein